jgi:hypothetical protein
MSNQSNDSTETNLDTIMYAGKAVADAARAAHPEASFARLSCMLQMAADWARVEAYKAEGGDTSDPDGEKVVRQFRERAEGFTQIYGIFGVPPLTWFGTSEIATILAGVPNPATNMRDDDPEAVRAAADYVAGNLLVALDAKMGTAPLALVAAFMADTSIARAAIEMPEELGRVEASIAEHRSSLRDALVEEMTAQGHETLPSGWVVGSTETLGSISAPAAE